MAINTALVVSGAKWFTKFCANRTTSAALRTMTDYAGVQVIPFVDRNSPANTIARFIGTEATALVITRVTSNIIDNIIDEAADAISDAFVAMNRATTKETE